MPPTEQPVASRTQAMRPRWSVVLRALREARGVTQEGWAAQLGVSPKTVQRWERGERAPDPGAEAAIVSYCRERDLFRTYDRGPLAGLALSAELLEDLLAQARWRVDAQVPRPGGPGGPAAIRRADGTPPAAPQTPSSNLPVPLTSFVGREREIGAVRRLLGGTRLLTLTGAGGCGKTRLALQVADELLWAYPHGVWFVELAAVGDPALVPGTVAAALDLRTAEPAAPGGPIEALKEFLRPRSLLLVLDNCEHLLPACATLVEPLLRACPHLEVLTTSREPLGIGGETIWQVPPMALPPSGWEASAQQQAAHHRDLSSPDSVRLFVERARLYRPGFDLSATNAAAVAEVCRRLDGIPLAIELAAARVRALSVEQIAARLEGRLGLLTGSSRTALPRHQTLRAVLDWSHDLLSAKEQALLRRLSVFAGGFELEAAEHVAAGDILDLLTSLVDKSLVIADDQGGTVRYRLLETVRQYTAEKLDRSGEVTITRDRHLHWYLALARSAEAAFRGPDEPAWIERLEQEHDNLRAALAWSLQRGDPQTALLLAGAMATFWETRGHLHEGRQWLAQALAAGIEAPAGVRAKALLAAGVLAEMVGDSAAARALHEESLCLYRQMGDRQGIASAQAHLGRITFRHGDLPGARVLFEASLALYRELAHQPGIAEVLGRLSLIALRQGDHDAVRALVEARLAIVRDLGNRDGVADALELLATVAGEQGDHEQQVALLEKSLALYRELGNRVGVALALGSLGVAAWIQGDYGRAQALLQESLALYREVGDSRGIARLLSYQGMLALYQRDYARAEALTREGLLLHRAMADAWSIGRYLPVLAGAAFGQGRPEQAAHLFAAAAALRVRLGTPLPAIIQGHHDRTVAAVRRVLGDDAFTAAWTAGETMPLDAVLDVPDEHGS